MLNPVRLAFAAAAIGFGVVFAYWFVSLRVDPNWNYQGWLCQGWLPLALVIVMFVLTVVGVVGARRWTSDRWVSRRANTIGAPRAFA